MMRFEAMKKIDRARGGAVHTGAAELERAELQRLIRYVERWRLAHFQQPDTSESRAPFGHAASVPADRRLVDADALLSKLRRNLQHVSGAQPASQRVSDRALLY